MKLESVITADLSQLEKAYGEAVSASKTTARQMDAAFKDAPKIDPSGRARDTLGRFISMSKAAADAQRAIGDSSSNFLSSRLAANSALAGSVNTRSLSQITAESLRAQTALEKLGAGISSIFSRIGAGFSGAAARIKASNDIIKESVETISSEIIESFGIDGDIANSLANELVKVRLSALLLGGAVVGVVAGVGVLTAAMASAAAQIRTTSQLTGLSTDQVQRYQLAASAAGVATDTFTEAVVKLRDRAKDVAKGNVDAAQAFQALGVNASDAARNAGPAFEKLLDVLQQVPDAQTRITVAQRALGDTSDKALAGILALTDAGGALRDRMNDVSVALDKQSVESLAKLNREWDIFTATAGNFAKRTGLQIVKVLGDIQNILVPGSAELSHFAKEQTGAAAQTNATTGAINNQASAISNLTRELASVRISAIGSVVSEEIAKIAVYAKNAKEAVSTFNLALKSDSGLQKTVADSQRFKANMEAINKLIDPDKPKKAAAAAAPIQPADTIQSFRQLEEARLQLIESIARRSTDVQRGQIAIELEAVKAGYEDRLVSTRDYYARRQVLDERAVDLEIEAQQRLITQERQRFALIEQSTAKELEQIRKVESAKLAQAKTPAQRSALGEDAANKIINQENQLAAQREQSNAKIIQAEGQIMILQQRRGQTGATAAREEAAANKELDRSFNDIKGQLLSLQGLEVEATGMELGQRFAEAMAQAIREGRADIVAAISEITRIERSKAQARQIRTGRDVAESGLEQQRIAIQNEVNRGITTETEAKRRLIEVEREARLSILASLTAERALAEARGDAAEAARISVEIEKANSLGQEQVSERMQEFQDKIAQDFDELFNSLIQGQQSFSDALKDFARNIATDILSEIQSAMIEELTGEESIGKFLGKAIAGFLGGLFGFGGERAAGGDVRGGMPYLVGEQGPELFVPRGSGYVMDARSTAQVGAGSQTVNNNTFNFQITSPDGRVSKDTQAQIASRTAGALGRASRRNS